MIISFKHKGLEMFYRSGKTSGIQVKHRRRLRMQLAALETASAIGDIDIPGYRLHQLKGSRSGTWSIMVSGNWRLTFVFDKGDVSILNYEDYH